MDWVERHGFGPLFILLCFPFTPSAVVNIVAGLSKINIYQYMLAVTIGKIVMIFTISFVGYDIQSLLHSHLVQALFRSLFLFFGMLGKELK